MAKRIRTKGQITIYKTYEHKIKNRVTPLKSGGNSGSPKVAPVVLLYSYKPDDKSCTRKGPGSVYEKWNISVVICDTDIP
jgi:hypothetical protein